MRDQSDRTNFLRMNGLLDLMRSIRSGQKLREQLVRRALGLGGIKLVSLPIGLLISILMARGLGTENFGLYTYILSLTSLVAFFAHAGLPEMLLREVAKYNHSGENALMFGIMRRSHQMALVLGVLFMVIVIVISSWNAKWNSTDHWTLIASAAVIIPISAIISVRTAILHGLGQVVASKMPGMLLQPTTFLIIAFVLFLADYLTPISAILAQVISLLVSLTVVSVFIFRSIQERHTKALYSDRAWRLSLIPFSATAAVSYVNTALFIPLVGLLGSEVDVAHFKVAFSLALLVAAPLTVVESSIHSDVARLYRAGSISNIFKITSKSGIVALLVSLPLVAAFLLYGRDLLQIVYGISYLGAYYPLLVLVVGFALVNVVGPSMLLLHATAFERDAFIISLLSTLVVIALCVVCIPKYGALGAAIAFSLAKLGRAISFRIWAQLRLAKSTVKKDGS